MHIGLIGGIGPGATVAYYTTLVQRFRMRDMPLRVTITHADMDMLISNANAMNVDAQAQVFAAHFGDLQRAGCDIGVITALTGHFCFARTAALSDMPLLSAIEMIDAHCAKAGITRLGLLGSPAVMNTHLFGLLQGPQTFVPDQDLAALGEMYLEMAAMGAASTSVAAAFDAAAARLVQVQGADAVLLAGTDLGLVFDDRDVPYPVVDALDLHVKGLLELAAGA